MDDTAYAECQEYAWRRRGAAFIVDFVFVKYPDPPSRLQRLVAWVRS